MMGLPAVPSHTPTLKGMPSGVCSGESGPPTLGAGCQPELNFWVENPRTPREGGQVGWKAETIGQHELFAGFAEFLAEVSIAVEHLAADAFGAGKVDVTLF